MMRTRGWLLAAWFLLIGASLRSEVRPVRLPHNGPVFAVVFSPDGRTLYSGGDDHLVRVWDVRARKELPPFEGHMAGVLALALTADGRTLVSAGRDGSVRFWDTRTRSEYLRLATSPG